MPDFQTKVRVRQTLMTRTIRHARKTIYVKGAVEVIAARCSHQLDENGKLASADPHAMLEVANAMASRGLRVLAFARREIDAEQNTIDHEHVSADLTFLGLQGKLDPPRQEAIEAVAKCRSAGIRVKMITGDHLLTAKAIAAQIGLAGEDEMEAINGLDLEKLSDEELAEAADRATVFARVAPEQKLRLVKSLQSRGRVVAMTGDVFDNLTKFIVWTLPTNFGEGLFILTAIMLGTSLPILPVQILWINVRPRRSHRDRHLPGQPQPQIRPIAGLRHGQRQPRMAPRRRARLRANLLHRRRKTNPRPDGGLGSEIHFRRDPNPRKPHPHPSHRKCSVGVRPKSH